MRNDELTQLIFARQLVSVMNRTKWRELARALTSNAAFEPTVRLAYLDGLYPEASPTGFAHLDWKQLSLADERVVRWLEIDPIRRDWVGRLAAPAETDFSAWVRESLTQHSIPFTEADGRFRIDAYLPPATSSPGK